MAFALPAIPTTNLRTMAASLGATIPMGGIGLMGGIPLCKMWLLSVPSMSSKLSMNIAGSKTSLMQAMLPGFSLFRLVRLKIQEATIVLR